jgi:hypothetical protein
VYDAEAGGYIVAGQDGTVSGKVSICACHVQRSVSDRGAGEVNAVMEPRHDILLLLYLCPALGSEIGTLRGVGGTLYTRMSSLASASLLQILECDSYCVRFNSAHHQLNKHAFARSSLAVPSDFADKVVQASLLHYSLNLPPSLTSGYTSNLLCVYSGIPFLTSSILPFFNSTMTVPSFSSNCPNTSALGSTTILCPHAL